MLIRDLSGAADADDGVGHGFEAFVGDWRKAVGAVSVGAFSDSFESALEVFEFLAQPSLLGEDHLLGLHGIKSRESAYGDVGGNWLGLGVFLGEEGLNLIDTLFDDRTNLGELIGGHVVE